MMYLAGLVCQAFPDLREAGIAGGRLIVRRAGFWRGFCISAQFCGRLGCTLHAVSVIAAPSMSRILLLQHLYCILAIV